MNVHNSPHDLNTCTAHECQTFRYRQQYGAAEPGFRPGAGAPQWAPPAHAPHASQDAGYLAWYSLDLKRNTAQHVVWFVAVFVAALFFFPLAILLAAVSFFIDYGRYQRTTNGHQKISAEYQRHDQDHRQGPQPDFSTWTAPQPSRDRN